MPGAGTTTQSHPAKSTRNAMAILVVAAVLLGALFVGAAAGIMPKSPTFAGLAAGQEYISSQARGNAFTLP